MEIADDSLQHQVFGPDSTKFAKMIAMYFASYMVGPAWWKHAIHHYEVVNNAIAGLSLIQIQPKQADKLQVDRPVLMIREPVGLAWRSSSIQFELRRLLDEKSKDLVGCGVELLWCHETTPEQLFTSDAIHQAFLRLRFTSTAGKFDEQAEKEGFIVHESLF